MKYDALKYHLAKLTTDKWTATFSQIEQILGFKLPRSAHEYPAWWANQGHGTQTDAWAGAGWKTTDLSLTAQK